MVLKSEKKDKKISFFFKMERKKTHFDENYLFFLNRKKRKNE